MRRIMFCGLGAMEVLIAVALFVIGLRLPSDREVTDQFARVQKATDGTERQVRLLREQVGDLRKHDFSKRAEQLRINTRMIADTTADRKIDFKTVEAITRSLGDVSKGINAWADTVDVERMRQVGIGLEATASFLETNVADGSEKLAADLEKAVSGLEKDGARLATLLRQSAPDLKAVRVLHDGLVSFDSGLGKIVELTDPERFNAMKEGIAGLETSLSATADQVDKVSAMTYPIVTVNGLKVNVENKPFWPEGEKVSGGLRKATKGVQATTLQMETIGKGLPDLRKGLVESRKSIGQTRDSLATVLKHQDEADQLLKRVPEQTAALAESLPKISRHTIELLRETKKLRTLAAALRGVHKSLDETLKAWPQIAAGLKKTSTVLDDARRQLESVATRREDYERAMDNSSAAARSFADLLPVYTDQLDSRLGQQEAALAQMETGISEMNTALPATEGKVISLFAAVRWLLFLVAAMVALHAAFAVHSFTQK